MQPQPQPQQHVSIVAAKRHPRISTAPAAPSSLVASATTSTSFTLGWTDNSSNESGFRIERALGSGSFAQIAQVGAGIASYVDSGLVPSTAYRYRVRAFNSVGNSAYSNILSVTTSAAVGDPIPVGKTGSWTLTFRDEFDGSVLDAAKWSPCYPWNDPAVGGTNNPGSELEWYIASNVTVSDGQLHLTARHENHVVGLTTYTWTSGMIASGGDTATPGVKFGQQYGYFEALLRTPGIVGSWPAFWNLPNDQTWPPEIDFLETFGGHPDTASFTYHWPPDPNQSGTDVVYTAGTFGGRWHVIGCEWRADHINWYVDGVLVKHYATAANITDAEMYLLFDLAVSAGHPPASEVTTMVMDVDYVRVWA